MHSDFEEFFELLKQKEYFCLTIHEHPDGDCLGSMFALGLAMKKAGKKVLYCCNEAYPNLYRFLPEAQNVVAAPPDNWPLEVLIALDCGDLNRLAFDTEKIKGTSCILVNIDHHQTNSRYGAINIVEDDVSATGEIIYKIVNQLAEIDLSIATCLMVAIVTDTGFFRYSNTTPASLHIAAELVKLGIDPSRLAEQVQERKKLSTYKLLGELLVGLETDPAHKIAWITVSKELLEKFDTEMSEIEGFVNYAKNIEGISIGVLFKEMSDGTIRISLRSGPEIDVSRLAQKYGGGGHARAAGCSIEGKLDSVKQSFLSFLLEQLN